MKYYKVFINGQYVETALAPSVEEADRLVRLRYDLIQNQDIVTYEEVEDYDYE